MFSMPLRQTRAYSKQLMVEIVGPVQITAWGLSMLLLWPWTQSIRTMSTRVEQAVVFTRVWTVARVGMQLTRVFLHGSRHSQLIHLILKSSTPAPHLLAMASIKP